MQHRIQALLATATLEEQLAQMRNAVVCSLCQLIDLKDLNTGVHGTRLAEWSVRIADQLGMNEDYQRDVEIAALLHDIGKVGIPDAVLHKPGRLTEDEFKTMQKHPEFGWSILRLLPGLERVSLFVLHHHERVDGKGYPAGLQGRQIPLGSRIIFIMDAFDSIVSSRVYRKGLPLEEALRRIQDAAGTQFDREIVHHFTGIVESQLPEVSQIAEPLPLHFMVEAK
jgi:HD-GYP domain-containing protein (c-di-GMP phosphodiesterase class II)